MSTTPAAGQVAPGGNAHVAVRPLPISDVTITDGLWRDWQEDNRWITIPHAFHWLERDGTVDNLRRLDPEAVDAPERRGLWFTDSDLYKALEGVAWDLVRSPAPDLEQLLQSHVDILAAAQAEDGYLNSFVQAGLDSRWAHLAKSHELYCIGHLIQAGIAHKRATGRDDLLSIALRAADCVVAEFGNGRRSDSDGHEEIEMALVELYRETGRGEYLALAEQLIDARGHGRIGTDGVFPPSYFQDSVPVREAVEPVGHAVRAVYLLAGVVDLYLETGDRQLLKSALEQWTTMTATKTYLNGALGSRFVGEAFGDRYELPPDLVYGETCATIGNIMLSWRLLLATGEARFADAIERALYNLFSAATSLGRDAFFYNNPAQRRIHEPAAPTDGRPDRADAPGTRPSWFECACCPPNIIRTIATLQGMIATTEPTGIQVQQYIPSTIRIPFQERTISLELSTEYPRDGVIDILVAETPDLEWTLSLRIPDWAPGPEVYLGDQPIDVRPNAGYVRLARTWQAGDRLRLVLDVTPRLTRTHPAVDATRGTVAIERGPVVYCFEDLDQPAGVDLDRIEIRAGAIMREVPLDDDLGDEFMGLRVVGALRDDDAWGNRGWAAVGGIPEQERRVVALVAIPYALWANRGSSAMRIFVPYVEADAR